MSTIKAEQYKNEMDIFLCRHEAGVQAFRAWLYSKRDRINEEWVGMVGDDLIRKQGEAQVVAKIIRLIDEGPTIKQSGG